MVNNKTIRLSNSLHIGEDSQFDSTYNEYEDGGVTKSYMALGIDNSVTIFFKDVVKIDEMIKALQELKKKVK